ncbi:helix-turn-helix domain-containing protein [Candidatus Bipolaricaulota bacterium]|nr:helix-turn-helix domain-containing protein [Candidatus Bipolaricaulota bacterium]
MGYENKLVGERLTLLELAAALGNVTKACKQKGISRSRFYKYKRRFQANGLEGLRNLPSVHKSHPLTTPQSLVERIIELSQTHPSWGCYRISKYLSLLGLSVSGPTIQKILRRNGMGTRKDRWLTLEDKALGADVPLTPEQIAWLEQQNPCFRERHNESSRPGELLCQDSFSLGGLLGPVRLQVVVDTYGSYAFARLYTRKPSDHAVLLLNNRVLPFYKERGLKIAAILTGRNKEYCGKETHPYKFYLNLVGIKHSTSSGEGSSTNGFVDRFRRIVLSEFVPRALQGEPYATTETLQAALNRWLVCYNTKRPHLVYRNLGRCPSEVIGQYLEEQGGEQTS